MELSKKKINIVEIFWHFLASKKFSGSTRGFKLLMVSVSYSDRFERNSKILDHFISNYRNYSNFKSTFQITYLFFSSCTFSFNFRSYDSDWSKISHWRNKGFIQDESLSINILSYSFEPGSTFSLSLTSFH
jgi:hypothetical protein